MSKKLNKFIWVDFMVQLVIFVLPPFILTTSMSTFILVLSQIISLMISKFSIFNHLNASSKIIRSVMILFYIIYAFLLFRSLILYIIPNSLFGFELSVESLFRHNSIAILSPLVYVLSLIYVVILGVEVFATLYETS